MLDENYKLTTSASDNWTITASFFKGPPVISNYRKSDRWANPWLGVVHSCNIYCKSLQRYCAAYLDHRLRVTAAPVPTFDTCQKSKNMHLQKSFTPISELTDALTQITQGLTSHDSDAVTEFSSAVISKLNLLKSHVYSELDTFLLCLSQFINGAYSNKPCKIEPFQKQIILHSFYFIVSIKAPEYANIMFQQFQHKFGLDDMDVKKLNVFKQKASVFLIPRRHGKTWIVVAIISILIATIENIHIGYVAHQKHVATSVFTEITDTLHRHFSPRNIEINKESSTISFKRNNKLASTVMCATCFNKNVSLSF